MKQVNISDAKHNGKALPAFQSLGLVGPLSISGFLQHSFLVTRPGEITNGARRKERVLDLSLTWISYEFCFPTVRQYRLLYAKAAGETGGGICLKT